MDADLTPHAKELLEAYRAISHSMSADDLCKRLDIAREYAGEMKLPLLQAYAQIQQYCSTHISDA